MDNSILLSLLTFESFQMCAVHAPPNCGIERWRYKSVDRDQFKR